MLENSPYGSLSFVAGKFLGIITGYWIYCTSIVVKLSRLNVVLIFKINFFQLIFCKFNFNLTAIHTDLYHSLRLILFIPFCYLLMIYGITQYTLVLTFRNIMLVIVKKEFPKATKFRPSINQISVTCMSKSSSTAWWKKWLNQCCHLK